MERIWNRESWNDLLLKVFGKINFDPNKYIGDKGLETAKQELLEFNKTHGRVPVRRDDDGMSSIGRATGLGYWKTSGIESWDDLIIDTFGRSNSASKYEGREGLDRAINELKGIYNVKGKLPSMDDAKAIYSAAVRRKYWRKFNILNWNELLINAYFW